MTQIEYYIIIYARNAYFVIQILSFYDHSDDTETMNNGVLKFSSWCNSWSMKFNLRNSLGLIFGESKSSHPSESDHIINFSRITNCSALKLLGVVFESKFTFEYD